MRKFVTSYDLGKSSRRYFREMRKRRYHINNSRKDNPQRTQSQPSLPPPVQSQPQVQYIPQYIPQFIPVQPQYIPQQISSTHKQKSLLSSIVSISVLFILTITLIWYMNGGITVVQSNWQIVFHHITSLIHNITGV